MDLTQGFPPPLPHPEQLQLVRAAKRGNGKARDRLIWHTMRLVSLHAWRKHRQYGAPLEDLLVEGAMAVNIAIDKFDLSRPVQFATYAVWWIRAQLDRTAIEDTGGSRSDSNKLRTYKRIVDEMRRGLTLYEACEKLATLDGHVKASTLEGLYQRLSVRRNVASLNAPVGQDGVEFGDFLADQSVPVDVTLVKRARVKEITAAVQAFREKLTRRERIIFDARIWYGDDKRLTLREVGDPLGISRERVRQIEVVLLRRARRELQGLQSVDTT